MSVSKWKYTPACDGDYCVGDCDLCNKEPEAEEKQMSKYIDQDALCEFARHSTIGIDANDIMRFPTADVVEVKHGEWVNPEMGYEVCSVCGYCFAVYDEHDYQIERNFCPNCGADMRERRKSDE